MLGNDTTSDGPNRGRSGARATGRWRRLAVPTAVLGGIAAAVGYATVADPEPAPVEVWAGAPLGRPAGAGPELTTTSLAAPSATTTSTPPPSTTTVAVPVDVTGAVAALDIDHLADEPAPPAAPAADPAPAPAAEPPPATPSPPPAPATLGSPEAWRNWDLLNGLRGANGLPALEVTGDAVAKAQALAERMAAAGALEHSSSMFAGLDDRWHVVVENVGVGVSADEVHELFAGDASHRANMLDPRVTAGGIGAAVGADGSLYIAQILVG